MAYTVLGVAVTPTTLRAVVLSLGAKRRVQVAGTYERPLAFLPTEDDGAASSGGDGFDASQPGSSPAIAPIGSAASNIVSTANVVSNETRLRAMARPELAERAAYTLSVLLRERGIEPDSIYLGLPAEVLTLWLLELPFSDRRKIEQVLPFELESQSLRSIDELLFDFVTAPPSEGATARRVLVVGAGREQVAHWLEAFSARNLELRGLTAAPLAYGALSAAGWLSAESYGGGAFDEPQVDPSEPESLAAMESRAAALVHERHGELFALVDIDRSATQFCVVQEGRVLFARTLPFGGELGGPLVRSLRQTLAAVHTELGHPVRALRLCGNLGQSDEFAGWLQRELGLPSSPAVLRAPIERTEPGKTASVLTPLGGRGAAGGEPGDDDAVEPWAALPLSIALGGALGSSFPQPPIELRRGTFAFRTDLSFLRDRLPALALALLAVLVFTAIDGAAALYKLRREETMLSAELKSETTKLFGEPRTVDEVQELVTVQQKKSTLTIPSRSAFDLLREISTRMPGRDKGKASMLKELTPASVARDSFKLDVLELEIRPRRTSLKATVDRGDAIEQIADALKELDCFSSVQKGKVTSISGGELRQFTLTFTTTCP